MIDHEELAEQYSELCTDDIKSVIMLNCGGSKDLIEFLNIEIENLTFYVIDSHLPHHIANINNTTQVLLFDSRTSESKKDEESTLTFYGTSAAKMCLDFAISLSVDTLETIWLGRLSNFIIFLFFYFLILLFFIFIPILHD